MSSPLSTFANLEEVATHLRNKLNEKKYILLFAYNGTGKTRLSMAFKNDGKKEVTHSLDVNGSELYVNNDEDELAITSVERDTLYFNAFTEDLFSWDNDLDNDAQRVLKINKDSRFFNGLQELEMENRIRPLLQRYADFDFLIDYKNWTVSFNREVKSEDNSQMVQHIKVSRGEENIFVWCFFLAVAQLAIDEQEAYNWVKYIYVDDPISSLDDNNVIAVASHLAQLLKKENNKLKTVISSHHGLFFNVMCNELSKAAKYMLCSHDGGVKYTLKDTSDTPYFHHVATLKLLVKAAKRDEIYTYHFNILRNILEKTATFHGFKNFSACIKQDADDPDGVVHARIINVLSHGNYSLYEPVEMLEENKKYFKKILNDFMENYRFNPELFPEETTTAS